jgi:hypothetical protein
VKKKKKKDEGRKRKKKKESATRARIDASPLSDTNLCVKEKKRTERA